MKSTLTRHDWEEYLIRLYFGNKGDLITLCINRAYRDLNRTLHGIDRHKGKHKLFNSATNHLRSIFIEIKETPSKPKSHKNFDKWHESNCRKLKNLYEENGFMNFAIGQAQKWINMTFKYIFCMGESRLPGYFDLYEFCHVPIDNIILDNISQSGAPVISCPWSRLDDYTEYMSLQKWFREKFDLPPLDVEFRLWVNQRVSPLDNVMTPAHNSMMGRDNVITGKRELTIGPYQRDRIVLCSADASPKSQSNDPCEAAYFFPGAPWVGAVRNTANNLGCKFVILTTGHGMLNPSDNISPYDLVISGNGDIISQAWQKTASKLMTKEQDDILLFYAGGCPRDEYLKILKPILHDLEIDLITFGKPNMGDVGKIQNIVELLEKGTSIDELKSVLKFPDRHLFFPHKEYLAYPSNAPLPSLYIPKYEFLWKEVEKTKPFSSSPLHGLTHWRRVFEYGLVIAKETGANIELVELFALFHDSCRLNDGKDPDHGRRAAAWIKSFRPDIKTFDDNLFQTLLEAIRDHTHVLRSDNIHIASCWDADRLDLGRVGTIPDPEYMNTEIAKKMLRIGR